RSLSDGAAAPGGLRSFPTRRSSDLLVTIYAALADKPVAEVLSEFGGQGFGAFKPALGELLVETLRPITARFTGLLDDREALDARSEEHTSELQSRENLVCRLLLEKK